MTYAIIGAAAGKENREKTAKKMTCTIIGAAAGESEKTARVIINQRCRYFNAVFSLFSLLFSLFFFLTNEYEDLK